MKNVEWGSDQTRIERARKLGVDFVVVPKLSIDDGIGAVRALFSRCWFDETRTKQGLQSLMSYQRDKDEKNKTFKQNPLHNWASHGADAFRMLAVGINELPVGTVDYKALQPGSVRRYSARAGAQGWMAG
jgi:phage terminase large subunit